MNVFTAYSDLSKEEVAMIESKAGRLLSYLRDTAPNMNLYIIQYVISNLLYDIVPDEDREAFLEKLKDCCLSSFEVWDEDKKVLVAPLSDS